MAINQANSLDLSGESLKLCREKASVLQTNSRGLGSRTHAGHALDEGFTDNQAFCAGRGGAPSRLSSEIHTAAQRYTGYAIWCAFLRSDYIRGCRKRRF